MMHTARSRSRWSARRQSVVVAVFLSFLVAGAVPLAGQAANGSISGSVQGGPDGTTLPGIGVQLIGPGGTVVETQITDDQGAFTFPNVVAGSYELRAVADDGTPLANLAVQVEAGAAKSVTLLFGLSEELTVSAPARATVEPTRTESLSANLLNQVPVADDVRSLLPLLPGIVRGADGRIQSKGGQATQGGYQVSGASVTDPSTGDFAFSLPAEAVESVEALANPFAAEYGRFTSGVTEMRTRPGDERWQATPNSFIPRFSLREDSKWVLNLRSFTPRLAVGGPLVEKRLFLAQSMHYRYVNTPLTALPGEPTIGLRSFDSYTRVDTPSSSSHQMTAALALFPRTLEHAGLNTFNPYEVTTTVRQRGFNAAFVDRWIVSPTSFLESMVNVKVYDVDVLGTGGSPMILEPTGNRGSFFNDQRRDTASVQATTALSHAQTGLGGTHLFKFGLDVMGSSYIGTSANRPIEIRRLDGTLSRRIEFDPQSSQDVNGADLAAFAQDRWRLGSPLTFELGLRIDRDGVTRHVGISPRAGVAITPDEDGRLVLRGGVGVFYQRTPLNVGAFRTYGSRSMTSYGPDGTTPVGGALQYGLEEGNLQIPKSVVWNAGFDRRIGESFALRLNHLRRVGSHDHIIDIRNDLDPLTGALTPTLTLNSTGQSRYWEQEFTLRYVPDDRHDLTFSYVRSHATGDFNVYDAFFGNARTAIVQPNQRALASIDVPNRFLAWGTFGIGKYWDVLPVLELRNGFPYSAFNENQDLIGVRNGAGRFPVMASLDLTVQRRLRIMNRNIRVGLRAFNVLNRRNYRDVQANLAAPTYGRFFNPVERSFGATFWIDR